MDFDDYEMKEREQEQEREQERAREELEEANQEEEETNFDDIDDVIIDIGNREDQLENPDLDLDGIPNVGKDVAGIKRSITDDIKKIFRDIFDVSIEKKNGKNSKDIIENTKFVSSKNGRISIEYKGSRIGWIEKSLNVNLFDKKNKKLVKEFRDSMELVKLEYEKSPKDFSKQSYKYDEDYLYKTWSRFKDYNYTIGSLIYMAREDDESFSIRKVYTRRELLKMCKDKGLKAFTSKSVSELCNLLCLPPQEKNTRGGTKRTSRVVTLANVENNETLTFKSIYSAAKFIGRNPGSVSAKKNTLKTLKSIFDNSEYRVEI